MMAPQLLGCYWVSLPRLPHPVAWPCSAHAQRRRVLRLAPPRRPYTSAVCVVADAGPALVLKPGSGPEFPSMEDLGGVLGHKEADLDERERLRRLRISKANKGNTPWNKGRKHSQETLQRIRERTRIAMQDPKVKRKLMNLGHAQSKETRLKISEGVRRGWSLRLQKLMVQDGCFVEWRDMIADAARKGFAGGVSLQWCSYKILTEQMRQEWLENVLKKRSMPRPRGNRRAPKTPEQRRKIAEAIAAKWLDQEYRERVCSGIASYHGTSTGTRTPKTPRPAGEPGVKRQTIKKKPTNSKTMRLEDDHDKAAIVKRKKSATPYKDPMAGEKLKMITKIRAQRAGLETEKKEAIRRARSLIAEAEKAVTALETVVPTSPCAHASLIEARKLVTEARTSLECVDQGHLESACASDDTLEDSPVLNFHDNGLDNQNQRNVMKQQNKHIDWKKLAPSNVNGIGFHLDASSLSQTEKLCQRNEYSMERTFLLSASSTIKDSGDFGLIDIQVSQSMVSEHNLTESSENCPLSALEEASSAKKAEKTESFPVKLDEGWTTSTPGKSLSWVRGKLVEVGNETGYFEPKP